MNNIFVLNKNYKKIGTLSNQGVNPQAPYYNDLYVQELDTGADTFQFSTVSNAYTQDCIEMGNHIMFSYKNRNELFTITSIEYSHSEGYKTVGVYAEGIGFELLEIYMKKPITDDSSSGGTDNDNDGDDNYDDEYADVDDIYIDANGNIIYDKDGSGLGDVTVDGNGNIIYKRSKNNRKNDSLEFKDISYPTFLNILLKNTDWTYVCQPGLEEVKHDITVKYDTNIYAILQDSMQSYRGVELEFVFEYNNGNIKKILKAYKDGGRGSFVGKRFEYGTNIKGITKTQKVANSEDDTVLYVDNVGIEVYYDVDFALKSAEVPEIEIGDTHYVIDSTFHPPMNIKARIGKIEVSFTDPTKNKIYLANNKKISGSAIEEELDEDTIKDIIDDTEPEIDDSEEPTTPLAPAASSDDMIKAPRMHSYEFLLYTNVFDNPGTLVSSRAANRACVNWAAESNNTLTSKEIHDYLMYNIDVFDVSYNHLDELRTKKTGASAPSNKCLRLIPNGDGLINFDPICNGEFVDKGKDYMSDCTLVNEVSSRIFSDIMGPEDRPSFDSLYPISNNHFDKHMLDVGSLACGLVSALQHHVREVHGSSGGSSSGGSGSSGNTTTFDNLHINKWLTMGSETGGGGASTLIRLTNSQGQTDIDATGISTSSVTCKDCVFARDVNASGDLDGYRVRVYGGGLHVFSQVTLPNGDVITSSSPSVFGDGNSSSGGSSNSGSGNYVTTVYLENLLDNYVTENYLNSEINDIREYVDDKISNSSSSPGSGGTTGCIFEKVTTNEGNNFYYTDNDIQIERDLYVNGTLHINSGDGMGMGIVDCDILKVTEIQFTNGTTLPVNNIATVSELSEYATVEALQEEIRAKDEQIANLEARLARIEAMLGINNDN